MASFIRTGALKAFDLFSINFLVRPSFSRYFAFLDPWKQREGWILERLTVQLGDERLSSFQPRFFPLGFLFLSVYLVLYSTRWFLQPAKHDEHG